MPKPNQYDSMQEILEKIKSFADNAHGDQMRKYTPERYIVHPIRVMETCRDYNYGPAVLAAALLHDVLEDTPVTRDEVSAFLQTVMTRQQALETLDLVVELTDVFIKANYPNLNRTARKEKELARLIGISPDAQTIKYADILDNASEISSHDPNFAPRFLKECRKILIKADKGNLSLRNRAMEKVLAGLRKPAG